VAAALGKIGGAQAVDGLVVALQDQELDVCVKAVWALGKIGGERAVDELIDALNHKFPDIRWHAALKLGQIREARAVDALLVALRDQFAIARWGAASALGDIGDARAIYGLVDAIERDSSKDVRDCAAQAVKKLPSLSKLDIAKMEAKRDVQCLIKTLAYKKDALVRIAAAEALGNIGDARAVDGLVLALKDEDANVRSSAETALGKIGGEQTLGKLVVNTNVDDETTTTNKGIAFLKLSQYSEAIKCLDEALKTNPNNGDAWLYKGLALGGLGQFAETIKCCDKALEINPYNLGALTAKRRATVEAAMRQATMGSISSDIVSELQLLKQKISALPQKYSTGSAGPNVIGVAGPSVNLRERPAQAQIPTICAVIDDAIKALEQGLDIKNKPITIPEIAGALKRLAADTRRPEFVFLVSTVLNQTGLSELEKCMGELEQIASKISIP
jgi:HEAT repeat protein